MNPIGTQVWVSDGETLTKIECVYDISGMGRARQMRDRTSLMSRGEEFELAHYETDEQEFAVRYSHSHFFDKLMEDGTRVSIYIGLPDSPETPSLQNGELIAPEGRSGQVRTGYIYSVRPNNIVASESVFATVRFRASGEQDGQFWNTDDFEFVKDVIIRPTKELRDLYSQLGGINSDYIEKGSSFDINVSENNSATIQTLEYSNQISFSGSGELILFVSQGSYGGVVTFLGDVEFVGAEDFVMPTELKYISALGVSKAGSDITIEHIGTWLHE